ncbi:MAG: hypothetical protein M3467_07475 [Actinomycetota bacterium]|nr:hypothetical protein [Actinomycetota bacterium]
MAEKDKDPQESQEDTPQKDAAQKRTRQGRTAPGVEPEATETESDPYGDMPMQMRPDAQDAGVKGDDAGDATRATKVSGINPGEEAQGSDDVDTPGGTLPPV